MKSLRVGMLAPLAALLLCVGCKNSKAVQVPELELQQTETNVLRKDLGHGLSLAVPVKAVLVRGKKTWVIVHGSDKKAPFAPVEVRLGRSADGLVEVRKGLKLGDRVLTDGALGYLYNDLPKEED